MSQNRTNENGAPATALPTDTELLQKWYAYASQQPGSVGSLLQLLRSRQRKSEEQQRIEFGVSAADFAKLQSIRAPRADRFRSDTQRIAVACHVDQVFHFVQMLMLARNLAAAQDQALEGDAYEAAFDALAPEQGGVEE